ncbi:uncharacterized protein CTRU02_213357 [Colletotrichum truncatum]|uniref:Uncharacterized protein n=1 Tax=Colletotrichum truncatum TaxID=5467 RepID=A0ACC3YKH2_COLTU|nr:uncharacterized protein CTRU02_13359 [Colletotrichum truncatum]KAF6783369.1 hypothetical protein CTRU02_13359 [Colletotrichum truncatum]
MTVGLIDILQLGNAAFTTAAENGKSFKAIFEDSKVKKCFWDVRNDADALWALYKVDLAGVIDIQLLENGSRRGSKEYLQGLEKSVESDLSLGFMERNRWVRIKKDVRSQMSADIFAIRPLDTETVQYCVNDVVHLPALHSLYLKRIEPVWLGKAMDESSHRVHEAHSPTYQPQSPTKRFGPWGAGNVLTIDEALELLEEEAMDARERDFFGYYDDDDDWYDDEYTNCADGAFDPEALASCWDKSG